MPDIPNLRTMSVTTSTGKDVKSTKMISGEAKNSLTGSNSTTQYSTSGGGVSKPLGGEPSHK